MLLLFKPFGEFSLLTLCLLLINFSLFVDFPLPFFVGAFPILPYVKRNL